MRDRAVVAQMVALAPSHTTRELASRFPFTQSQIQYILRCHKVRAKDPLGRDTTRRAMSKADYAKRHAAVLGEADQFSVAQLAERHGMTIPQVQQVLMRHGISARPPERPHASLFAGQQDAILANAQVMTIEQLAAHHGVTKPQMGKFLYRRGVRAMRKGAAPVDPPPLNGQSVDATPFACPVCRRRCKPQTDASSCARCRLRRLTRTLITWTAAETRVDVEQSTRLGDALSLRRGVALLIAVQVMNAWVDNDEALDTAGLSAFEKAVQHLPAASAERIVLADLCYALHAERAMADQDRPMLAASPILHAFCEYIGVLADSGQVEAAYELTKVLLILGLPIPTSACVTEMSQEVRRAMSVSERRSVDAADPFAHVTVRREERARHQGHALR